MPDCIFCQIVAGEIPATVVYESSTVIGFEDLNPTAPTHILLIPRSHFENAAALAKGEPETVAVIMSAAGEIASQRGLAGENGPQGSDQGYRIVANTGAHAGQSVFHVHFHLLGGRALGWPPG